MAARALHAVKTGEKPSEKAPVRRKPMSVAEAASKGTYRDLLVAQRDRIALAVDSKDTSPRDLAALTKRLSDTVREIAAIDARAEDEDGAGPEVGDGEFDASAV